MEFPLNNKMILDEYVCAVKDEISRSIIIKFGNFRSESQSVIAKLAKSIKKHSSVNQIPHDILTGHHTSLEDLIELYEELPKDLLKLVNNTLHNINIKDNVLCQSQTLVVRNKEMELMQDCLEYYAKILKLCNSIYDELKKK